jgi:hypothetical protein
MPTARSDQNPSTFFRDPPDSTGESDSFKYVRVESAKDSHKMAANVQYPKSF